MIVAHILAEGYVKDGDGDTFSSSSNSKFPSK